MADRLSDIRLRACLDHLKGWQREPGSWIADCAVALIELIERRAVETTTRQPEKPVAWYRWGGSALRPIIAWGDWPPPEPDDTAWYPLYSSPEGRPAVETPDGYKDAYYKIADLLGMSAMPISPKEAFETVMLPRLRQLIGAVETAASPDIEQAFEAGWRVASRWAERDDLLADIGSAAYHADLTKALKSVSRLAVKAAAEPTPAAPEDDPKTFLRENLP